ncbi:hypothetical protein BT63DRAFT_429558 [Microthyrium microscopicum]|uniref:Transcription factor IIA, alpha/beta subunit n=1 Tax=Microthyrium microscopicum TaxID=703497 RepID=A0A6A6TYF2_9PEZI|nr:hypothetical protein BT63DRAFT_429558 [Microthyrium microscopicum]
MSNQVVGDIYRQIMEKTVHAAQTDFEEGGYAPETLVDLQKAWQENLTKLHVAKMPWDPVPPPPAKQESNDALSVKNGESDVKYQPQQQVPKQPPEIKYEPSYNPMSNYNGAGINPVAQQRAANNLVQQFGPQANASIQASGLPQQRGLQQPQQQQRPQQMPAPGQGQRGPPNYSQTDGAGDSPATWDDIVTSSRASVNDRIAVDGLLKRHLEEQWSQDDSQVFHELTTRATSSKSLAKPSASKVSRARPAQLDGPDDEEDEDAINSDLDDSEDEMEEQKEDDEGPLGEMILCTWDKVNRVKNKWKCTLKDGVLATGGKEYLFHKATGEFEW